MPDTNALTQQIEQTGAWVAPVRQELSRIIVGQEQLVHRLLVGLLTNGHILLEGVPGLAKTLTVRALAGTMHCGFSRIQFTPDLLPADILGTLIYNPADGDFKPKLGPIFSNLILADEINRAPAKVQSALLEAMQERQVTIGDQTYPLSDPFLVLATQNPIDQEGTYRLPEAQMDRFLLKVSVGYPSRAEERQILDLMGTSSPETSTTPIIGESEIRKSRELVNQVYIDPVVKDYIVDIVCATRADDPSNPFAEEFGNLIRCGASPRGSISLTLAARACAFLQGRGYVIPQDIKDMAPDVLRHRILLSYEAEAENIGTEDLITQILQRIPVP